MRDLPGYPSWYVDLVENGSRTPDSLRVRAVAAARAASPRKEISAALHLQAEQLRLGPNARQSLAIAARAGTVFIAAEIRPALFGGTLAQMLACLTAVGLAQDLNRDGYAAVPVVCIAPDAPPETDVRVVDAEGRLVALHSALSDSALPPDVREIVKQLDAIYSLNQSTESLHALQHAYSAGVSISVATRGLMSELLEPWGALAVNCGQAVELQPALVARVVAPNGMKAIPDADGPVLWPSLNATLVDARSRRLMEKYGLSLADLFSGEQTLLRRVEAALGPEEVLAGFGRAAARIEAGLGELSALVPPEDPLQKAISDAHDKMNYQIEKVKERYSAAISSRREIAARQLDRLCNTLAPGGAPQQLGLAAAHFVLRYSRAVLPEIVSKTDPYNSEHQQIDLE